MSSITPESVVRRSPDVMASPVDNELVMMDMCVSAIAAIWASSTLIGRPARVRADTMAA